MRLASLALLSVLAFPRLGCGSSRDGTLAGVPAPSASVLTVVAEVGSCEDLAVCERECDAGSSDRCRRLGVSYEFGRGVVRDGVHATGLYEKSCAMGNTEGCLSAGRMYEFEHGVAKDYAKAVGFYRHACDAGDQAGCANLAIMLEAGRGVAKDTGAAAKLFGDACKHGSSLACAHAKALAQHDAG